MVEILILLNIATPCVGGRSSNISTYEHESTDRLSTTVFFATSQAQSPAASTLFIEKTETQFSINLANDSSDVYIYFTSPAYSWVGVGFGEGMKNSLMLVMYPNKKGNSTLEQLSGGRSNLLTQRRRHG